MISLTFGMWSTDVGGRVHGKRRLVSSRQHRATKVQKLCFCSSCQYTHGCCALAFWAAQHTTVCLDLSNRANFQNINEIMSNFSNSFIHSHNIDTPIEELWNIFKTQCETCLNLQYQLNHFPAPSNTLGLPHPSGICLIRKSICITKSIHLILKQTGLLIGKLKNSLKENVERLMIVMFQISSVQMIVAVIIIKDSGVI